MIQSKASSPHWHREHILKYHKMVENIYVILTNIYTEYINIFVLFFWNFLSIIVNYQRQKYRNLRGK